MAVSYRDYGKKSGPSNPGTQTGRLRPDPREDRIRDLTGGRRDYADPFAEGRNTAGSGNQDGYKWGRSSSPSTGWESRAKNDPEEFMRAAQQQREAGGMGGLGELMDMLFGGQGAQQDQMRDALASSYDNQIGALRGGMDSIEGHYGDLIGGINDSSDAATDSIGGFYDYAASQANAGKPVVQEAGAQARGELDAIYDEMGSQLAQIPGLAQEQASQAGGEGATINGRVEAAAAPFRAAGESGRASSKANVVQGTNAADNYLGQLAAAAPSEAAQQQGQVQARADQAVTSAQMALAEQQAQMEQQAAQLEGAKQRALIEHTADVSGDAFGRFMQQAQLFDALGADKSVLRDSLGLPAAQQQGEALTYEDQLDIATKEQRLNDMMQSDDPYDQFAGALQDSSPTVQQHGQQLMDFVEQRGLTQPEVEGLISRMTTDDGVDMGTTGEDGFFGNALDNATAWIPGQRKPGDPKVTRNEPRVEDLEQLLADPEAQMWVPFDPSQLRGAMRKFFN